jgi:CysZ protein
VATEANFSTYNPRAANPVYHFVSGFRFYFAGLRLLARHPGLLALSAVPIALTVVALVGLAAGGAWLAGSLVEGGGELRRLTEIFVFLLALVLGYLIYMPLARVLLAPFSEALSRRAHAVLRGSLPPRATGGWARAMLEGAKLVTLQLTVLAAALALGLILPPVGGPIGVAAAVIFAGLDYLDVPLSVRGLTLGRKLALLWRHKALALGFGLAGYCLLLIPLVNLLSLPVGVIGATRLVAELDEPAAEH